MKIIDSFYLTDSRNIDKALELTGLSLDELEKIVGRFKISHYKYPKKLKGEVIELYDGTYKIRHHFTKKIL